MEKGSRGQSIPIKKGKESIIKRKKDQSNPTIPLKLLVSPSPSHKKTSKKGCRQKRYNSSNNPDEYISHVACNDNFGQGWRCDMKRDICTNLTEEELLALDSKIYGDLQAYFEKKNIVFNCDDTFPREYSEEEMKYLKSRLEDLKSKIISDPPTFFLSGKKKVLAYINTLIDELGTKLEPAGFFEWLFGVSGNYCEKGILDQIAKIYKEENYEKYMETYMESKMSGSKPFKKKKRTKRRKPRSNLRSKKSKTKRIRKIR